jgi:hypothetical protein
MRPGAQCGWVVWRSGPRRWDVCSGNVERFFQRRLAAAKLNLMIAPDGSGPTAGRLDDSIRLPDRLP